MGLERDLFRTSLAANYEFANGYDFDLRDHGIAELGALEFGGAFHHAVEVVGDGFGADVGGERLLLSVIRDISERKVAEVALRESKKLLSWQASHDALTGLVNRREFQNCLEKVVNCSKTSGQKSTLCFMDLDRFKTVNDTCGHCAGDELLRQISSLLQSRCRKTDTLGRLGGDEFGLLLYQCSIEEAQRVVQTLYQSIQEFRFVWQDKTFAIGISIGVVGIDSCSLSPEEILNAADTACYIAKNQGRNQVQVYQVSDLERY